MSFLAPTHEQAARFIGDCWLCYCIVWIIAMFGMKRTVEKWGRGSRIGYLLSWVLAFSLLDGFPRWDQPRLFGHGPRASFIACAACLVGLAVTFWARFVLGRNWSGNVTFKEDHVLVEQGPYRFVRHPIYTGLLLMMLGWAIQRATPEAFLGVAVFFVAHLWKLRKEETLLRRHFPDSYPAYCGRTKALVPGLF